ncbi:hypothetical protein BGW80DRAFT_1251355 [Lactifluus volemus]|nr:hypothetical protein BGW80DRAFT_1251355 [Lactifluus volemus]
MAVSHRNLTEGRGEAGSHGGRAGCRDFGSLTAAFSSEKGAESNDRQEENNCEQDVGKSWKISQNLRVAVVRVEASETFHAAVVGQNFTHREFLAVHVLHVTAELAHTAKYRLLEYELQRWPDTRERTTCGANVDPTPEPYIPKSSKRPRRTRQNVLIPGAGPGFPSSLPAIRGPEISNTRLVTALRRRGKSPVKFRVVQGA